MKNLLFSVGNVLDARVVSGDVTLGSSGRLVLFGFGGVPPYSWTVTCSNPALILVSSEIQRRYEVSFTPEVEETLVFTVTLTDARRVRKVIRAVVRVRSLSTFLALGTSDGQVLAAVGSPFSGFYIGVQVPPPA